MSFIPGANVGPYRIVEQAERNGVATTYTAYQPSVGRYVSLVVVSAIDREDDSLFRQYQRQLELVLSLRHPNILTVIDTGEHLGVPFVVTEMIEAESLADRLGAPWPLAEVVRVLRPIAVALDYAHSLGIVHSDIRSSSVLLTPDGTPMLSGFGLMTRPLAVPVGVPAGDLSGRPSSPLEEVTQAQPADRRGLALVAYEMLTGRTTDVESAELTRPLLPAQIGSPLLAAPVERVLLRELTGEVEERYPSATAFVDDLSTPVESTRPNGVAPIPPIVTPPPTASPSGTSGGSGSDSRRRLITVALIFAALALLGALAILLRGSDAARPIASPGRTPGTEVPTPATSAAGAPAAGAPSSGATTGAQTAGASAGAPAPTAPAPGASASGAPASSQAAAGGGSKPAAPPTVVTAAPQPKAPSVASVPGQAAAPTTTTGTAAAPTATPGSSGTSVTTIVPTAGTAPAGPAPAPPPPSRAATAAPAAAGSTRLPVTWRVVGDPSGRWMLDDEGRVAGRTETGASVVLFPESVDDVGFSASVNTTSCQATLVFRAQDDENLLMAIYIPDGLPAPGTAGGGVWLYQRVEGLDLPIRAVRPSTVRPAGEPSRLKIVTSGPNISIFLNDEPALQAVDTAPRAGRLGLMVYSTSGRLCEATFGDIER